MTLRCYHGLFFALAILEFFTTPFPPSVSARSVFPNPNVSSLQKHKPWEALSNFTSFRPGQKYKGLSNVKSYFHQFDYIPNMPLSNFTDDFDDTLVTAIQTYQQNYNLKVTGVLDDTTLRHMALPRCGVPDIINNNKRSTTTTSFGNGKVQFRMVSHYAHFSGMPRWPVGTQQLTYAFLPANNLNNASKGAFARAFDRWAPVVKITFRETALYETANVKVAFLRGNHGDGFPFDGTGSSLNTLAHAFAPTDGRCHFDADEVWVAFGDVTQSEDLQNAFDLETVAVHEIGHLLGLDHSFITTSVMYPSILSRTRKVELAQDDIQGIRELYNISN